MNAKNTYRIFIWIIVILAATTISMGASFWYHKQQDKKAILKAEENRIEMPAQQRTRFFREQLDLRMDQMEPIRELNRNYNWTAQQITRDLEALRINMVQELGKQNSNKAELETISKNIGELHAELKTVTIDYYLEMKAVCDKDQQKKLNEIFMSMLKSKEDISLPQRGRKNWGNHNNN